MAIDRVDFPTTPNPVSGDWSLQTSLVSKAFQNINNPIQWSGTNILQGATFQIGGIVYYANADTAITGTLSDYVKLTPNVGDSGATCDAAFVPNLTGVTWNKLYNGYYDTGDLVIFDEVKEKLLNTLLGQVANSIFPIGFVYHQFPNKEDPVTLGMYGTWTNISSEFAGDFFRAEGGDAAAFETHQDDAVLNHTHSTAIGSHSHTTVMGSHRHNMQYGPNTAYETWLATSAIGRGSTGTVYTELTDLGTKTSNSPDLGTKTSGNPTNNATENRPNNYAIRLWERVA
jgi:hypothetical protein